MKKRKALSMALLLILGVILLTVCGLLGCSKSTKKKETSPKGVSTGKTVSIPTRILDNKFGFLSGGPGEPERIKEFGGLWGRPHPGPFLWDSMQKVKNGDISYSKTDRLVKEYQEEGIGLLVTLWPFADWDQKQKSNASDYKVSENDEFLPRGPGGMFQDMDYLPRYRGNPFDWKAYRKWVKAIVERYDGDGKNDMPGLKIPIKYWEVMNEPDLTAPEGAEDEGRLDFYTEDAEDYGELLIKTSEAIKEADSEAKILIAGAAGGNDRFLHFYRQVFADEKTILAFDIANVHCISNDEYESFNVEPYLKMLQDLGIDKPVWVTEAEAMISDDQDINATQTMRSSKKALELGAERIFFTSQKFEGGGKPPVPEHESLDIEPEIDGSDPEEVYKTITSQ